MIKLKRLGFVLLILLYLIAGINHFVHPGFYIAIIPPYLPYPILMNILAGVFEILFAVMLIAPSTRNVAVWGIILMLAAFMPVHIYMIRHHAVFFSASGFHNCLLWGRLFLQPLLMLWAWAYRKRCVKTVQQFA